jgi:hypothetical protein
MSRRQADVSAGIMQCEWVYEYPDGQLGPYSCTVVCCSLEYGHSGPHEDGFGDQHGDDSRWSRRGQ